MRGTKGVMYVVTRIEFDTETTEATAQLATSVEIEDDIDGKIMRLRAVFE